MYTYLTSRLLMCCPQGALLIPLRKSEYPTYNDDEYEKYEPRPKIVVDPEVESLKSFSSEKNSTISSAGDSGPTLVTSMQYSTQKKTVIVKVSCLKHMESNTGDEQFSVRVVVDCCKTAKQQTSFISPERYIHFNETFSYSQVDEASIRDCGIKFRVYSRKGRTRGTLRGEASLDGDLISFDGPTQHQLLVNRIDTVKSEITVIERFSTTSMPGL